ncbi:lipoprotein signal peptidase [Parashewanella spongiae]|uniref:Lipoprotein signal peptidase n=1 Tax=Parashewanella spongiae TaxID=342950 RepID=A0A3A6TD43_9GAMM|nr:signal peptidase II [Parashewanella spongiae]MCL1079142.1 signal peptidase II [Parashewanella spongiae]RJY10639.1 lipoprotein signal peptidase [Parashewanella spongiae]
MPLDWKQSGLRWYWVVVVVFIIDQLTKQWVIANFDLYESINLMPLLNFTYVRNYGAAFSFLSDAGGWQRWFFTAIAVGISGILSFWLRKQPKTMWRLNLAFTLVIGGALGNLIDRLMHGFVIDFVDVYWNTSHYPAFNVADSAICIGAGLIILDAFVGEKPTTDTQKKKQEVS